MQHINYFQIPFDVRKNSEEFVSVMDGYLRGNLQKDLYQGYKHYEPTLPSNYTAKEALMMTIQAYEFACNDLSLFLDVHPDDEVAMMLYREYQLKLLEACKVYSEQYGPINKNQNLTNGTWKWLSPWMFGGEL